MFGPGIVLQRRKAEDIDLTQPPVELSQLIRSWIRTDVSSFQPLILDSAQFPQSRSFTEFRWDVAGIRYPIHYINLPHSSTTLNFTNVESQDIVIIATSKNSLEAALNALNP